jgi:hypothetical protein
MCFMAVALSTALGFSFSGQCATGIARLSNPTEGNAPRTTQALYDRVRGMTGEQKQEVN